MPWQLKKSGDKYDVVSQRTGKTVGHKLSKKRAKAMMRALYANVPDATKNESSLVSRIQTRKRFVQHLLETGHPNEDEPALLNMSLEELANAVQNAWSAAAREAALAARRQQAKGKGQVKSLATVKKAGAKAKRDDKQSRQRWREILDKENG